MRALGKAGVDLVKRFEGCRLEAYQDSVGVWTIGYGHTEGVKKGQKLSQHQADEILKFDLEHFAEGVEKLLAGCKVTDNQFAACVSLAFNVGLTNFANSTLRSKLLKGDVQGAADQFPRWNRAGGKVLAGLVKRREAERALFLKP